MSSQLEVYFAKYSMLTLSLVADTVAAGSLLRSPLPDSGFKSGVGKLRRHHDDERAVRAELEVAGVDDHAVSFCSRSVWDFRIPISSKPEAWTHVPACRGGTSQSP